jgi:hypothetical protein
MNSFNQSLKALSCGVGALAITLAMGWSFVQTTSTVRDSATVASTAPAQVRHMAEVSVQQRHVWFGQSRPAVLVD